MTKLNPLAWRALHVPKAGHAPDEYEDAFAGDPVERRFAIADGAAESAFAASWARILVNAFVRTAGAWSGWLATARERWCAQVQERELAWYTEAKFQEGAYAALLGVEFTQRSWLATAIGDSCLFQVRDQRLLRAFPLRHSSEFGNRPSLLGSRSRQSTQLRTRRVHWHGHFQADDVVFLMTDALAHWFLVQVEDGREPWKDLQAIGGKEDFVLFVDKLRHAKDLRNDDVTLVLIEPRNS